MDWISSGTWCFTVSKLNKHGKDQSPFKLFGNSDFLQKKHKCDSFIFLVPHSHYNHWDQQNQEDSLPGPPDPLFEGFVVRERSHINI